MLLNSIFALLGHYVTSSSAQAELTALSYAGITVGQPFNLTWANADGPVTITLVRDTNHNDTVASIISNSSESSYLWTPPYAPAASEAPFAFEITDSKNEPDFSAEFNISDSDVAVSTSSSETSSAATTSSSSSSSATTASSSSSSSATVVSSSSSTTTGLGIGAKAGIGVGVALGILLIVILTGMAIHFYRRYRATIKSNEDSRSDKPELDGIDRDEERRRQRAAEITGVPINELNAEQIGELNANVSEEPLELE